MSTAGTVTGLVGWRGMVGSVLLRVRLSGIDPLGALTAQSRGLATRDPLTGVFNRRGIEERIEANSTRFAAVFHSVLPEAVDPIRSGRTSDLDLLTNLFYDPRGLITDSRFGADFFNHLISLQDHLLAGDSAAILNNFQLYRLVTALTLHADIVHLLGNCFLGGFLLHFFFHIYP